MSPGDRIQARIPQLPFVMSFTVAHVGDGDGEVTLQHDFSDAAYTVAVVDVLVTRKGPPKPALTPVHHRPTSRVAVPVGALVADRVAELGDPDPDHHSMKRANDR